MFITDQYWENSADDQNRKHLDCTFSVFLFHETTNAAYVLAGNDITILHII